MAWEEELKEPFELKDGTKIPKIGLGTWQLTDEEVIKNIVKKGYRMGYRLIDTASKYENEEMIGRAIADLNEPRENLFITTKLWATEVDEVRAAAKRSIEKLQCEYLDLYLIHFPYKKDGTFDIKKVWGDMEKLVKDKIVRSIGVSNFGLRRLQELLDVATIKPVMNQIELHPYLPQNELYDFCKENGIHITSYSTLGSSGSSQAVRDDPVICKIAEKNNVTPAKVLLGYALKRGCCVIPRTSSVAHLKDNFHPFEPSDEDMKAIAEISTRVRYVPPPPDGAPEDVFE